jgi:hypothetical protein
MHMTARWAYTYKVVDVPIDQNNFTSDDKAIDRKDKKTFIQGRYSFGQPERAFMTVSKFHRDDVQSSNDKWHRKMHRGMKIASATYNSSPKGGGGPVYEGNGPLLLDTAAFAISGTTTELEGLIDDLDNSFKRIKAGALDNLYIAWARVGKRKLKTTTETATIVVIAPYKAWWCGVSRIEEDIYKDKKSWHEFKTWTKGNDILLTDLKKLVQQGEGVKSWIAVDAAFFE